LIPEVKPAARRVGVLGNADDPFIKPFFEQIERGASIVGLEVHHITVRGSDELNGAFAAIARERADAVVVQGTLPVKFTVDLALKYQLPSLSTQKSAVQAGILMSYTASFAERAHVIASYVDQILKGTKPADLPVQQPTKYELAINLKTAKALGVMKLRRARAASRKERDSSGPCYLPRRGCQRKRRVLSGALFTKQENDTTRFDTILTRNVTRSLSWRTGHT
jgi:ABC-type uncharacterized transport system substrate-binding protein